MFKSEKKPEPPANTELCEHDNSFNKVCNVTSRGTVKTGCPKLCYSSVNRDWPSNGVWGAQEAWEPGPASTESARTQGVQAQGLLAA